MSKITNIFLFSLAMCLNTDSEIPHDNIQRATNTNLFWTIINTTTRIGQRLT